MANKVLKRSETDKKYTWRLEDIYPDAAAWRAEYAQAVKVAEEIESYKGRIGESSENMLAVFTLEDKLMNLLDRIYCYAHQLYDQDTANAESQALSGEAENLMVKTGEMTSFVNPEMLTIDDTVVEKYMNECEGLKLYAKKWEYISRKKPHVLSLDMEAVLASVDDVLGGPKKVFGMFNNADVKFGTIKDENGEDATVTHGRYGIFIRSNDRRVREEAFHAMHGAFKSFENTIAANYESLVKGDIFSAKTRKYNSSIESYLFDGNIPLSVYDNLIDTIHAGLPLMHRYVKLRKKALGLDELHMYDVYTPMVKDFDMHITFDEAKEIVKKGVAPLGEDYIALLDKGFNGGWVDVYENEGKRSGAYSWGPNGVHPYVLLNHQDNLDSMFTLAHEMGHALHSYKSNSTQPLVYAGYRIFVAEVASTCNEALLNFYLIENAKDKNEKAYLINHFLDSFKGTVYRQTMFAEFEKKAHELAESGKSLTAKALNEMYYELNKQYFGSDMVVDKDIEVEWARIPHFYTPFYVYQYATGFSAAVAIASMIRKEGQPAVDRYMKFLSSGGSDYPIELLKIAGVDMSKPDAIRTGLDVFAGLLDEMEALLAD